MVKGGVQVVQYIMLLSRLHRVVALPAIDLKGLSCWEGKLLLLLLSSLSLRNFCSLN